MQINILFLEDKKRKVNRHWPVRDTMSWRRVSQRGLPNEYENRDHCISTT